MRPFSAQLLLDVWERGLCLHPVERAQDLLAAACPETPPEALANLSIGNRDAELCTLRELTFGPEAIGVTKCPACGEPLELSFDLAELRTEPAGKGCDEMVVRVDGFDVYFRMPNSRDLVAVSREKDVSRGRILLFERCLLSARRQESDVRVEELPEEVVRAVAERMAEADPQADVWLDLACISCGHRWQEQFDIGSFFWSEIHAWASRLLSEVHTLARTYGWREADILAMHPWRRQFYLEMVRG